MEREPTQARNALVAIDGSEGSRHALAHAIALARAGRGRLTLLTVVSPVPWAQPGVMAAYDPRCTEEAVAKQLRAAAAEVPDDVPVTTWLVRGHAVAEIVRCAVKGNHDVVVLGCEGHGPLGGVVTGVSQRVRRHCRHCEIPVVVVRVPTGDRVRTQPLPGHADRG
jgi:nucleotide-binding universal stress UspA family protein